MIFYFYFYYFKKKISFLNFDFSNKILSFLFNVLKKFAQLLQIKSLNLDK
jgi:hypothetical protein